MVTRLAASNVLSGWQAVSLRIWREEGRDRGRERGREGGMEGGRYGGREGGRERGREGDRETRLVTCCPHGRRSRFASTPRTSSAASRCGRS